MSNYLKRLASPTTAHLRQHVFAFDLLRCVAAFAVVLVHVLGPYRDRVGAIPNGDFASAVALNGALRWSVPVFIMISGALLLADSRPFRPGQYLQRRVGKVVVPFVAWSLFYAGLAGLSRSGFDPLRAMEAVRSAPFHETYYHLGFFYYFIPLYLVIPLLRPFVARAAPAAVLGLLGAWLIASTLFLAGTEGLFSSDLVIYSGYLLLGYALWQLGRPPIWALLTAGLAVLVLADYAVITKSFESGVYRPGRWFSYKTANSVCLASLVFSVGLCYAERLPARARAVFVAISRHSLGVYLLHPLFLWPVREFDLYGGPPLLVIPFWTLLCGGCALALSIGFARIRATRWLVP